MEPDQPTERPRVLDDVRPVASAKPVSLVTEERLYESSYG